jgi:hypothetical protein
MSTVNTQINDSVVDALNHTLGNAPAEGMGLLDTVMAETVGMLMHNAVSAQQNSQMIGNAALTATCAKMLEVPFPSPSKTKPVHPGSPDVTPGSPASGSPDSGGGGKHNLLKQFIGKARSLGDDPNKL